MELEKVNQALAQLEDSLRELDSARKQVQAVTESSSNLTSATSELAKDVKEIAIKIKEETTLIISTFSKKLSAFEEMLTATTDDRQQVITNEVEKFKNLIAEMTSNTVSAINEVKKISIETIETQKSEITKTISALNIYTSKIKEYIEILVDIDVSKKFFDINNKIDIQEKNTKIIRILLFITLSLSGVSTAILIYQFFQY